MSRIAEVESWVAGALHVVRVTDDEGRQGIGQSACWAYPEAVDAVVQRFKPALLGADPSRIEALWHRLFRFGPFRGSIISGAVSAVDIALWDLRGRVLETPVHELLGGPVRDRLRLHCLILGWSDRQDLAARVEAAVADGFTAVKIDPLAHPPEGPSLPAAVEAVVSNVAAAREAAGRDVDVIVELHRGLDALRAPLVIEALAPLQPLFVEDPIQIDSIAGQAELAARHDQPLGQGERVHSIWEVRELLAHGGAQVLRCDVGLAGGISHACKIAALAEAFHADISFHTYNGPVVCAAAAHVGATIQPLLTHEWYPPLDEPGAVPGFVSALRREGGWLVLGEQPGLGVDFDPNALQPLVL